MRFDWYCVVDSTLTSIVLILYFVDECPTDCSSAPTEQVCGSDLVTYPSQCELLKHSCEIQDSGNRIEVLFYGSCQHRGAIHMYSKLNQSVSLNKHVIYNSYLSGQLISINHFIK